MTTKHDLDTLDRATLIAWRAGNVLKWSIAALAVAFAVATGFYLMLSAFPDFSIEVSTPIGQVFMTAIVAVPTVLSSIAMGVLIGRHVFARPLATGAAVATVHLALSVWFAFHGVGLAAPIGEYAAFQPLDQSPLPLMLMAVLQIYATAVIARSTWEKRPRALRGKA
jgi:signal transduction histidine kinase